MSLRRIAAVLAVALAMACDTSEPTAPGVQGVPGPSAVLIAPGTVAQVSAGWHYACALRMDGMIACWGHNMFGRATPPPGEFVTLTSGGYTNCALKADGTLACWGD